MLVTFDYNAGTSTKFEDGTLVIPPTLWVTLRWDDDPDPEDHDQAVQAPLGGEVDATLTIEERPRLIRVTGTVEDLGRSSAAAILGEPIWQTTLAVMERAPSENGETSLEVEVSSLDSLWGMWQELSEAAASGTLVDRPPSQEERDKRARDVTLVLSDPRGRAALVASSEQFFKDHQEWEESRRRHDQPEK